MAKTTLLNVANNNLLLAIQNLLKSILELDNIEALLVPKQKNIQNQTGFAGIMPTLISDPADIDGTNPLAPAFVTNAAKLVSKLTHKPVGKKIAVVLRPCEINALTELVKLKQASLEDLIIIGIDCLGAYTNKDIALLSKSETPYETQNFIENALGGGKPIIEGYERATACKACENPVPQNADILIGLFGVDIKKQVIVKALTEKGDNLFSELSLKESESIKEDTPEREKAVADIISERIEFKEKIFKETNEATNTLEKLSDYFTSCINCYNCRVACPVCYCRECVFNTDVFNHDPYQYIQWAKRKGSVKMPTDTSFYHITRLAHMSLACVGCGQCSNACPNDIPVMELFKYIADTTQTAFEYKAGEDINQPPPLSIFKEEEYLDVVGIN